MGDSGDCWREHREYKERARNKQKFNAAEGIMPECLRCKSSTNVEWLNEFDKYRCKKCKREFNETRPEDIPPKGFEFIECTTCNGDGSIAYGGWESGIRKPCHSCFGKGHIAREVKK